MTLLLLLSLSACVSYEEKALTPEEIISQVEYSRSQVKLPQSKVFTFDMMAQLMSDHSPVLKQLKANYAKYQSVANIKTPWSNPSFEVGQSSGSKFEADAVNKTGPFISLAFSIPLSGRLGRLDDLNKVKAKKAFYEVNISHREMYLNLRQQYVQLHLSNQRQKIQQEIVSASAKIAELSKALRKVGASTALDVGMMELESSLSSLELLKVKEDAAKVHAQLSALIGVDAKVFKAMTQNSVKQISRKAPSYKSLKTLLISHQPDLIRIRAEYEVAEKQLRLEISKQYPDIHFGGEQSDEVGEKKIVLGLSVGIKLPLFDRNQQGIAKAEKYREQVRAQYITQTHKVLAELKRALTSLELSEERKKLLKEVLQPQAENNLSIAEQSLRVGGIDALKYLEVKREQQSIVKEVLNVESDLLTSWIDLEKAVGYPLLEFSGENNSSYPKLESQDEKEKQDE